MPFINSKVSVKITKEQEEVLKKQLGEAISLIPGKSESWLMLNFEQECNLYFKGQKSERIAFIEVEIYGKADKSAYNKLTATLCKSFYEVLDIPEDKIYVKYEEVAHWGWNGSNF